MNQETWIDGFNFFYHWEHTRGLLAPGGALDIVSAIDRSVRILGRHLGQRTRSVVLFLDGGLERTQTQNAGMRVRYCGPGRKADDRMADDLAELGSAARMVTAVSDDRELRARLRTLGASCLGTGEYLALLQPPKTSPRGKGRPKGPTPETDDVLRMKTRALSSQEVDAWLEYFGGDTDGNT